MSSQWKPVRYILVPCSFDAEGKIKPVSLTVPPYGYHHILAIHINGDYRLAKVVKASPGDDNGLSATKDLAGDLPIETNPDFYTKLMLSR